MKRLKIFFMGLVLLGGLAYGGIMMKENAKAQASHDNDRQVLGTVAAGKENKKASEVKNNDSPGEPSVETKSPASVFDETAIRQIMDRYFAINELAGKYMEEKGYWKDHLNAEEIDLEGFYPLVSHLITREWLGTMDELMVHLNDTFGEGMGPPDLNIRMDVLENTAEKILIRTAKLPDDYGAGYNPFGSSLYITIIRLNGDWLVDNVLEIPGAKEPLDLSWEEAARQLKKIGVEADYAGTAVMDGPIMFSDTWEFVNAPMKVYLIDHPDIKGISAVTGRLILESE